MRLNLQNIVPALLALLVIGPITAWSLDKDTPADIVDAKVITEQVTPGGNFEVEFNILRDRQDCDTMALRAIIDGANVMHVIEYVNVPTGPLGAQKVRIRLKVPDSAKPGNARYRAVGYFVCNPLHRIWPLREIYPDRAFEIISANDALVKQLAP